MAVTRPGYSSEVKSETLGDSKPNLEKVRKTSSEQEETPPELKIVREKAMGLSRAIDLGTTDVDVKKRFSETKWQLILKNLELLLREVETLEPSLAKKYPQHDFISHELGFLKKLLHWRRGLIYIDYFNKLEEGKEALIKSGNFGKYALASYILDGTLPERNPIGRGVQLLEDYLIEEGQPCPHGIIVGTCPWCGQAQALLGAIYARGLDHPDKIKFGCDLVMSAFKTGASLPIYLAATIMRDGKHPQDTYKILQEEKVIDALNQLKIKMDGRYAFLLGICYRDGLGVKINKVKANHYFKLAAEDRFVPRNLPPFCDDPIATKKNFDDAAEDENKEKKSDIIRKIRSSKKPSKPKDNVCVRLAKNSINLSYQLISAVVSYISSTQQKKQTDAVDLNDPIFDSETESPSSKRLRLTTKKIIKSFEKNQSLPKPDLKQNSPKDEPKKSILTKKRKKKRKISEEKLPETDNGLLTYNALLSDNALLTDGYPTTDNVSLTDKASLTDEYPTTDNVSLTDKASLTDDAPTTDNVSLRDKATQTDTLPQPIVAITNDKTVPEKLCPPQEPKETKQAPPIRGLQKFKYLQLTSSETDNDLLDPLIALNKEGITAFATGGYVRDILLKRKLSHAYKDLKDQEAKDLDNIIQPTDEKIIKKLFKNVKTVSIISKTSREEKINLHSISEQYTDKKQDLARIIHREIQLKETTCLQKTADLDHEEVLFEIEMLRKDLNVNNSLCDQERVIYALPESIIALENKEITIPNKLRLLELEAKINGKQFNKILWEHKTNEEIAYNLDIRIFLRAILESAHGDLKLSKKITESIPLGIELLKKTVNSSKLAFHIKQINTLLHTKIFRYTFLTAERRFNEFTKQKINQILFPGLIETINERNLLPWLNHILQTEADLTSIYAAFLVILNKNRFPAMFVSQILVDENLLPLITEMMQTQPLIKTQFQPYFDKTQDLSPSVLANLVRKWVKVFEIRTDLVPRQPRLSPQYTPLPQFLLFPYQTTQLPQPVLPHNLSEIKPNN